MSERIRFHLDEHIDPDVATALRRHGIDVTTTVEGGLRSASDPEHLQFAIREGRVIVTGDGGFVRLAAARPDHPGIVLCRPQNLSVREMIRGLLLVYEVLAPGEIAGRVEYL